MPHHTHASHRITPGSRTGTVEVRRRALAADRTEVTVAYTLTALSPAGTEALAGFEGERFAAMIDGWAREIAARIGTLRGATIR